MITITRSLAKELKTILRRAFPQTRHSPPAVEFVQSDTSLTIRAQHAGSAVQYQHEQVGTPGTCVVPFAVLDDCEGTRREPVTLTAQAEGKLLVEWSDKGIPQLVTYDQLCPAKQPFPALPNSLATNPPELLSALATAVELTDPDSARYALGCLQLAGSQGRLAATDGRQALMQAGFQFGFAEDLLLPATKLFSATGLQGQPVEVGRTEEHLVFRIGRWTFWLAIRQEGRFPHVEDVFPRAQDATTEVHLAPADARFLAEHVGRLPADGNGGDAVTVDLNGAVAIRSAASENATELVLTNSHRTGSEVRIVSSRQYLERAAKLGFTQWYVSSPDKPVLCQDGTRSYVWMLHHADNKEAVPAHVVQVASPLAPAKAAASSKPARLARPTIGSPTSSRISTVMPTCRKRQPQAPANDTSVKSAENDSLTSPMEQALALRSELRNLASRANSLVRSLQQQRRQERLLRSTLASLKQLQAAG